MLALSHILAWVARRSPLRRFRARQRRRLQAICRREGCSRTQAEAIAALAFRGRTYGVIIAAVEPRRDAAAPHVDRQRDAASACNRPHQPSRHGACSRTRKEPANDR